jgi:hypothetical protein
MVLCHCVVQVKLMVAGSSAAEREVVVKIMVEFYATDTTR